MTRVTRASLAYVATQVPFCTRTSYPALTAQQIRFGLSSVSVFSRTDTVTDSEGFYTSILSLLEDPEETAEVTDLLTWWDWSVQHQAPPSPT